MRDSAPLFALTVALLFVACNDSSTSPSVTTPTTAVVSLSVSPNPIHGVAITDPEAECGATNTLTITETGGLGGNIDGIIFTVLGVRVLHFGAGEIGAMSGTNRVSANGSLSVDTSFRYTLMPPGNGCVHSMPLTVTVEFTDDRGNNLSPSLVVSVN